VLNFTKSLDTIDYSLLTAGMAYKTYTAVPSVKVSRTAGT